jgi:hypothetical protein
MSMIEPSLQLSNDIHILAHTLHSQYKDNEKRQMLTSMYYTSTNISGSAISAALCTPVCRARFIPTENIMPFRLYPSHSSYA